VVVIDKAQLPEARSRPSRFVIVAVSVVNGALILLPLYIAVRIGAVSEAKSRWTRDVNHPDPSSPSPTGRSHRIVRASSHCSLGTLTYELGLISVAQAAGGTALVVLLGLLAWFRFDRGRHPCFLFLCVLTLLQAGRSIAYLWATNPSR